MVLEPLVAGVATSSLILVWLFYRWQDEILILWNDYKRERGQLVNIGLSVILFMLFLLVFNNLLAAVLAVVLFYLTIKRRDELKKQARGQVIESQAEVALQLIASFYENTGDIMKALKEAADCIKPPLADELKLTVAQYNANTAPLKALQNLADRINDKDMNIFVNAVILSERYGTNTGQIIEEISHKISERISLRDELKNEAWGESITLKIFSFVLPVMTILLMFIPDIRQVLVGTFLGKGIIIVLLCVEYYAWSFATNQEVINSL